ncbi:glycosyltransferase [bacterium TMED221]|nr:MAG: glycosyltransferase [bacterium TMED221]|tara:strand:+ start:1044 stop:1808 length:765 start_codon:yes stop_codon:yes gene_type:complete
MKKVKILNTNISEINLIQAAKVLTSGNKKSVAVCNANSLVRSYKDVEVNKILNSFDIALPDGFPVAKASSILYKNQQKRVDGYKIFNETIRTGIENNTSHYFFGNSEQVIQKLISELKKKYPKVNIAGYNCPPIDSAEALSSPEYQKEILNINPDIVWVSLGFPKQEKVIANFMNSKEFNSNFVGIGFAIEWVAGTKIKAPEFLANVGLEWVFRLIQEPKRLYKRYLIDNSLFIFYFIKQILLNDKESKKDENI